MICKNLHHLHDSETDSQSVGRSVGRSVRRSVSHSVNSGALQISNKFLNVALRMLFLSILQESAYKPVYAVFCTDGKVS